MADEYARPRQLELDLALGKRWRYAKLVDDTKLDAGRIRSIGLRSPVDPYAASADRQICRKRRSATAKAYPRCTRRFAVLVWCRSRLRLAGTGGGHPQRMARV